MLIGWKFQIISFLSWTEVLKAFQDEADYMSKAGYKSTLDKAYKDHKRHFQTYPVRCAEGIEAQACGILHQTWIPFPTHIEVLLRQMSFRSRPNISFHLFLLACQNYWHWSSPIFHLVSNACLNFWTLLAVLIFFHFFCTCSINFN